MGVPAACRSLRPLTLWLPASGDAASAASAAAAAATTAPISACTLFEFEHSCQELLPLTAGMRLALLEC